MQGGGEAAMMAAQTPRRVVARLEPLSAEAKLAPLRQLLEDGSITPEVYARARSKLDAAATPQPEPQPEPERGAEEGSSGGGGGGARKDRAASPPLEPSREEWTAMLQPSPAALAEGNSPSEVSSYDTALTADSRDPQMLAAEARTAAFVSEAAVEATLQGATERLEAELALQQPRQGPEEGAAVPAVGLRFNHTPQEAAAAAAARRREQHDAVLAALAAREAALAQREDAADRREAAIEQREAELEAAAAALAEERALHQQEVAALASRAEALRSEGEAVGASAAELRLAERGVREAEGALAARREALSQREQELLSEDFALVSIPFFRLRKDVCKRPKLRCSGAERARGRAGGAPEPAAAHAERRRLPRPHGAGVAGGRGQGGSAAGGGRACGRG